MKVTIFVDCEQTVKAINEVIEEWEYQDHMIIGFETLEGSTNCLMTIETIISIVEVFQLICYVSRNYTFLFTVKKVEL